MKFKLTLLIIVPFLSFLEPLSGQNSIKIIGGSLKITDNVAIILKDCQLQNNGTITATNGTIEIKGMGTKIQSQIGGTGTSQFHNLKINKSSNDAQLSGAITVNNQLEMVSGSLDLLANNLTLGTVTGTIIGESETTSITSTSTGKIIKTLDLNAPNTNPGNMGITIQSAANLGSTTIRRGHNHQTIPSGTSIFRHFTITPTTNVSLAATLTFHYLNKELNGLNENALVLLENNGGWMIDGFTNRNATNNTVTFSGYDGLHQYTLGNNVDDADMDGIIAGMDNCPNNANADQADADNDMVGNVCDACAHGDDLVDANMNSIIDDCECQSTTLNLAGNLAANHNYIAGNTINSVEVINAGMTAMYKATSAITLTAGFHAKAGTNFLAVIAPCQTPTPLVTPSVSRTINEPISIIARPTLTVAPNPFIQQTEIQYTVPFDGNLTLTIQDLTGRELSVLLKNQYQQKGTHTLIYNAHNLPVGMYILVMQTGQQVISEQLVLIEAL